MSNNCILNVFFLLCFSFNANTSDYMTINNQNEEMSKAFSGLSFTPSEDEVVSEDQENFDYTILLTGSVRGKDIQSTVITSEELQSRKKIVSTKILHSLNDSLNFLLTTQKILSDFMLTDPTVFRATLWQTTTNKNKLDFPLRTFPSPLADAIQGGLILTSVQYWINIIAFLKNTIFSEGIENSFEHNNGFLIKNLLPLYIKILEERVASSKVIPPISQLEDKEVIFLQRQVFNFYPLLLDCVKNIYETLPKELMSEVNLMQRKKIATVFKGQEQKINQMSESLSESVLSHENIYKKIHDVLKIIRSRELFAAMEKNLSAKKIREMVLNQSTYKSMFEDYRQRLDAGYAIFFPEIEELIKDWQKKIFYFKLPEKLFFNGIDFNELLYLAHTKTYPELNKLPRVESLEVQEGNKEKKEKVELPSVQSVEEYFKQQHAYHQQRKNQAHIQNIEVPVVLSAYERNLFNFILDNIYGRKNKPTWKKLVKGLGDLGFRGQQNKVGNGSTWVFSVTHKNQLFFNNKKFKGATFNVHKFTGNEAINHKYLSFFQTGLANVFGLTNDYIKESLKNQL